ncbi:MAG: hypothetical protein ACFFA5_09135 [Promethearchaeota archaeon]
MSTYGRREFTPVEIRPPYPVKGIEFVVEAGSLDALARGSSHGLIKLVGSPIRQSGIVSQLFLKQKE